MSKIELRVYTTKQIDKNTLLQIFKLKNEHWMFSINSQRDWFIKNIKNEDTHIILLKDRQVVGYNCLRKYKINSSNFYLFDTLIINKIYRNKGYADLIMKKNSQILVKKRLEAILYCNPNLESFYKKYGWERINKKNNEKYKSKSLLKFNKDFY